MLIYRLCALVFVFSASAFMAGCGNKDTGQTGVKVDPGKVQQDLATQIKEVENNPNIPPGQKQAVINRIKSQGAMSEAGRATGGGK